jgi:hypothetical protein
MTIYVILFPRIDSMVLYLLKFIDPYPPNILKNIYQHMHLVNQNSFSYKSVACQQSVYHIKVYKYTCICLCMAISYNVEFYS